MAAERVRCIILLCLYEALRSAFRLFKDPSLRVPRGGKTCDRIVVSTRSMPSKSQLKLEASQASLEISQCGARATWCDVSIVGIGTFSSDQVRRKNRPSGVPPHDFAKVIQLPMAEIWIWTKRADCSKALDVFHLSTGDSFYPFPLLIYISVLRYGLNCRHRTKRSQPTCG